MPGRKKQNTIKLLMTMIAEESLDFGEWADTSNTGDATLEHYAAQVRQLASDYQHVAPYPLVMRTRWLRDRVFAKLKGHQRPAQTRELYLIAAQVCGLLAWMSGEMSFHRNADAHAWTGWVCAEYADHDGARTWIRAIQSKLAYWDGRFDQAQAGMERAGDDEVGGLWSVIPARYHSLASNIQMWRHDSALQCCQDLADGGDVGLVAGFEQLVLDHRCEGHAVGECDSDQTRRLSLRR